MTMRGVLVALVLGVAGPATADCPMTGDGDREALLARLDYLRGDDEPAFEKSRCLAEAGVPRAQLILSVFYEHGIGTASDPALSLDWLQKAADQGYPHALFHLGLLHGDGDPWVTDDPAAARAYHAKAAALDFTPAMTALAVMLRDGQGGAPDPELSVALLERAVSLGHPQGTAEYAYMLATGDGAEIDLPRARELYEVAAAQGIVWAIRDYGEMLELAEGGPADLPGALDYYRRAMAEGSAMAALDIAEMFWANPGVFPDQVEALAHCLWAEAQPPTDNGSGADYVGRCAPEFGRYTEADIAEARRRAAVM